MLNNIVDNIEQCGQHNIFQGCFHHPEKVVRFFAVYMVNRQVRWSHKRSETRKLHQACCRLVALQSSSRYQDAFASLAPA